MINGQKVSAFVICYNEESCIRDCLESIKWADELVVVDSFSQDATVRIAREYTDRVIRQQFLGYVAQTRFAFEQTTCPWVLWLDADERLTQEAREQLRRCLERPGGPDCDGYAFPRKTRFMGRWIAHSGWYPQHKLRLFRRELSSIQGTEPHPVAVCRGKVGRLAGDILHLSYPGGVTELVSRSTRFAELAAQARFDAGKRFSLPSLLSRPPLEFLKKYLLMRGFLDGLPGLVIAVGAAYYRFVREAKLWELERG